MASPTTSPAPAPDVALRPRLRGVWHLWAAVVSAALGVALVIEATSRGGEAVVATAVYAFSVTGMLATSAAYHRIAWTTAVARARMRRLDHAMIFVLIGGTYTPVALLALDRPLGTVVLGVVWGGALAGILISLVWITAPRWLTAAIYVAVGWVAVLALGPLTENAGAPALVLFVAGGLLYTTGAVVYARRRPDPLPGTFGYHELFHAFVLLALAAHFAAVAFRVLPQA